MKLQTLLLLVLLAMLAAAPGAAAILDISNETTAALGTGDTLAFQVLGASFRTDAAVFGLSGDPTGISFAFVTAPVSDPTSFSASLESADGTASVALDQTLGFADGWISGSGYTGPVSILRGFWQLSPLISRQIFNGAAVLKLHNDGPDIAMGLEPYKLRQDLLISLSGGPLSVGGIVSSLELETAARRLNFKGISGANPVTAFSETLSEVPEPESSVLFLSGGAFLCGISLGLNRIGKRRR